MTEGKTGMGIINSAANPQVSLDVVGKSRYKVLGQESVETLKKYNMMPK